MPWPVALAGAAGLLTTDVLDGVEPFAVLEAVEQYLLGDSAFAGGVGGTVTEVLGGLLSNGGFTWSLGTTVTGLVATLAAVPQVPGVAGEAVAAFVETALAG